MCYVKYEATCVQCMALVIAMQSLLLWCVCVCVCVCVCAHVCMCVRYIVHVLAFHMHMDVHTVQPLPHVNTHTE